MPPAFVLLSHDFFLGGGHSGSSLVPYKFESFFFCEKCNWNFDREGIESIDGKMLL